MSDSVRPHRQQPTRLPRPWDSPGKNNGVGCHFLLQSMKVKNEREVAQSCPTLRDPMDCSLPGSSAHGIFQARVLEWVAIAFSVPYLALHYYNHWSYTELYIWSTASGHLVIIIFVGGLVMYLVIARKNNLVKQANTNNIVNSITEVISEN